MALFAFRWMPLGRWWKWARYGALGLAIVLIGIQLLYPTDRLLPLARIDEVGLGGWTKHDAASKLDAAYKHQHIQLFFGDATKAYKTPLSGEIGLTARNQQRLDTLNYPWWLRLVPTSIFWAQVITTVQPPSYKHDARTLKAYLLTQLSQSCNIAPKNAQLTVKATKLTVLSASSGGTCRSEEVEKRLSTVTVQPSKPTAVRIAMKKTPPAITNAQAEQFAKQLTERIGKGITLITTSQPVTISATDLLSWLDFANTDKLAASVNKARASEFFTKQVVPKVAKSAGVSHVTTYDFVETARVDGATGQTLDTDGTLARIANYLNAIDSNLAVVTKTIPARVEYTRSYSPTDVGLSALLQHYAEAHPGTYGISLIELSGQRRRASYQGDKQFTTASTYKLFVAYSTLKRIEAGSWHWSDAVQGSRNLAQCFDDMIVKSDNPCPEALLPKIGFRNITNEAKELGLTKTTFLEGDTPKTSPNDLSTFLAILASDQMLTPESRNRLVDAMKRNIYRRGIPAGTSSQVADKVGFLNGLLHDAAIVYSPTGPVVLTIMTDGSSWDSIADLTRQIETLRQS